MEGKRIGIVGGGQLGRMLTEAAKPMGFEVSVVDPADYPAPAAQAGADQIVGRLDDEHSILELARVSDVVTWEIEHIPSRLLMELNQRGHDIQPSPYDLRIIQDKLEQKNYLKRMGIPIVKHRNILTEPDLQAALEELGPVIVKARMGGYDGRGNLALGRPDWTDVIERFGEAQIYAEQQLDFQKELSVLVAKDKSSRMLTYPVIETIQQDGQCNIAVAPARITQEIATKAKDIALATADLFGGAGVFAIEMFLTKDNEVLVNEVAPRVHNSGHLTIEGNKTSQFEQHIRAITGLPLGNVEMTSPAAMVNILGERDGPVELKGLVKALAYSETHVHIYGKAPTKVARKMGHITVKAQTVDQAIQMATKARRELSI